MTVKSDNYLKYEVFDLNTNENIDKLPVTVHGNHFLLGNAGFPCKEAYERALNDTEKTAEKY